MPINVSSDHSFLAALIHHRVRQNDDAGDDAGTGLEAPRSDTESIDPGTGLLALGRDIYQPEAAIAGNNDIDPSWLLKSGLRIVTTAITPLPRVMKDARAMFAGLAASNRQNSPSDLRTANTCRKKIEARTESGDGLAGDLGIAPTIDRRGKNSRHEKAARGLRC